MSKREKSPEILLKVVNLRCKGKVWARVRHVARGEDARRLVREALAATADGVRRCTRAQIELAASATEAGLAAQSLDRAPRW